MSKDEIKMVENVVKVNEILIKMLAEIANNESLEEAVILNEEVKKKIAYKKDLNSNTPAWNGRW